VKREHFFGGDREDSSDNFNENGNEEEEMDDFLV
jgi:hypothetical protein